MNRYTLYKNGQPIHSGTAEDFNDFMDKFRLTRRLAAELHEDGYRVNWHLRDLISGCANIEYVAKLSLIPSRGYAYIRR